MGNSKYDDKPSGRTCSATRKFYGFPCEISFDRGGSSRNYADIELFFNEGFQPDGCRVHRVAQSIKEFFGISPKDIDVEAVGGVNKLIKFKWCCSLYQAGINKNKDGREGYNTGSAGVLLDIIMQLDH